MTAAGRRTVAVHQPNFLPWLGYFAKYLSADVFVFLNDAQLQKTGGSIVNRVKFNFGGEARWVSIALDRRFSGVRKICQVQVKDEETVSGAYRSIASQYRNAPFFGEADTLLRRCLADVDGSLADWNQRNIEWTIEALGLPPREVVRSSDLSVAGTATARLVEIVRALGGTTYIHGTGALAYQENELFGESGIDLAPLAFSHPSYWQPGTAAFLPGLSVFDAIANCGLVATRELLVSSLVH